MSTKRKLRRAREARVAQGQKAAPRYDREVLRRRTEAERFKTPGSDKLWLALLGWDDARRSRAWLMQAIHDGVRASEGGSSNVAPTVIAQFAVRAAAVAPRLDVERVRAAVELWASGRDENRPKNPEPHWHYIATLVRDAGLGDVEAEALQDDWETWTSLELASAPRQGLMDALAQTERAAAALHATTRSEPVEAVAHVARLAWAALAYGDEDLFARLRDLSRQWLTRERS